MWRFRTLASRLRGVFTGNRSDRELNTEIEEHLRLLAERFMRQGLSPDSARHAARRQFGGIAHIQEDLRERRGIPFVENLGRDLVFSLRMIRKQPGFSLIVFGILAIGLGANTAIFSLVNGILLHPLPFAHPQNLVAIFERNVVDNTGFDSPVAPANYLDWQEQTTTLDRIAAISYARLNLSGTSDLVPPERIDVCACSANLFDTVGTMPALGRQFRPEEDRPGAPPVAVISYDLWKHRFKESPQALSGVIKLDSRLYTVIGVMPPDFSYPARSIQAWIPIQSWLSPVVLQAHDNHLLTVIGRLQMGFSVAQANAEIDAMVGRYKRQHPEEVMGTGANVVPLAEVEVRGVRKLLLFLFGAVSCVLLIACVNVANLLLARSAGRQREVSIRAALGAARRRIVFQLLIESLVLSLMGGFAGMLLALELINHLTDWAPGATWIPQAIKIRPDPAVFFFGMSMALAAGAIAGLFPALRITTSLDLARNLKESGRGATPGQRLERFRDTLVATEVALALILLVAAGVLIRSFGHLVSTDLGLRTSNRLTMQLSLPDAGYHERVQVSNFLKELSAQLQSIPGVIGVGLSSCPAITRPGFCPDSVFQIEPQAAPFGRAMDAQYRGVSPDFFRAAGIPILRGRTFTPSDGIGVADKNPLPGAAVINLAFAKKFFPSEDPIDHFIRLDWFVGNNPKRTELRYRIIGISGDVLERPQSPVQPTFYLPLMDGDSTDISIILHTGDGGGTVARAARSVLQRTDPDLAVFAVQSMDESLNGTTGDRKFVMILLAAFAGMAMILASIGLYGVVSWGVSQSTKEIAIRIALGATSGEMHRMVLLRGLRPALLGIATGIPGAAFITRLMRGLLFDVHPIDAVTFTSVPIVLLTVTVLACVVPAVRATRVDPTIGLRVD
jgi:predicted permease